MCQQSLIMDKNVMTVPGGVTGTGTDLNFKLAQPNNNYQLWNIVLKKNFQLVSSVNFCQHLGK